MPNGPSSKGPFAPPTVTRTTSGCGRILRTHFAALLHGPFARMAAELSLLQIAAFAVGLIPRDLLQAIAAELAAVDA